MTRRASMPAALLRAVLVAGLLGTSIAVLPMAAPPPAAADPTAAPPPVTEAPDEATAAKAAKAQGKRVEVTGQRTENETVFVEPNGVHTAELSAVPTRARKGAGWA